MIEKWYIILIWLLGFVVRVAYIFYAWQQIERSKIVARLVISIIVGYIVGWNISEDIERNGIMFYWPIIWISSFFAVDIVEWLLSPHIKAIANKIIKKYTP